MSRIRDPERVSKLQQQAAEFREDPPESYEGLQISWYPQGKPDPTSPPETGWVVRKGQGGILDIVTLTKYGVLRYRKTIRNIDDPDLVLRPKKRGEYGAWDYTPDWQADRKRLESMEKKLHIMQQKIEAMIKGSHKGTVPDDIADAGKMPLSNDDLKRICESMKTMEQSAIKKIFTRTKNKYAFSGPQLEKYTEVYEERANGVKEPAGANS